MQAKVYLESHRDRRSETHKKRARWAIWTQEQVSESKEGPLELRSKKGKENTPGGRRRGKAWTRSRERERGRACWVFVFRVLSISKDEYFRGGLRGGSR